MPASQRRLSIYFGWSAVAFGIAGATLFWKLYSQEERLDTHGSEGQRGVVGDAGGLADTAVSF